MAFAALLAALSLAACQRTPSHPLTALAIRGEDAPAPCDLAKDAEPWFMLPGDPTWKKDLQYTIGWFNNPDLPDADIDAALSHLLRRNGELRPDKPAVSILAMRFKDAAAAEAFKSRLAQRYPRPNGPALAVANRMFLSMSPTAELPAECEDPLWRELLARLDTLGEIPE